MNGYENYNTGNNSAFPRYSVPRWVYTIIAAGLVLAVIFGIYTADAVAVFTKNAFEKYIYEDTNGDEDFSLQILDFENFLGVKNGVFNSRFDVFPIEFYKSHQVFPLQNSNNFEVSGVYQFNFLNGYEHIFLKEAEAGKKFEITVSSEIKKGNFELRIYQLNKKYEVTSHETYDIFIVKNAFLNELFKVSANENAVFSFEAQAKEYYIIAVACESAMGTVEYSVQYTE